MNAKKTVNKGDYFVIPMSDGRGAVCQAIWMGIESEEGKFKNVFAFCVVSVGTDQRLPDENKYLVFEEHCGPFTVIFTAVGKCLSGEWPWLGSGVLDEPDLVDFEFNMAGNLYRSGYPVRMLPIDEYRNHLDMGISGYALVERYLMQH
ncbi:hypothetical protein [Pseudomonas folii]|uniref:Immunity protein 26 n=1 Tax=Pseudomonas folii TaxID=2762593 RepID=A0ABR7AW27_9PSED|nr:hypothetical protein [Pseudomonas folii]MBC3949128.1 hypothetical protein [Pseudomonas folii]